MLLFLVNFIIINIINIIILFCFLPKLNVSGVHVLLFHVAVVVVVAAVTVTT
jgi:hypothetical protein